ncbi:MAG TPA: RDD family protein [Thermomicrobiales bacterium]|nr:RDD family protein [Thermomicrobiales bacterium]
MAENGDSFSAVPPVVVYVSSEGRRLLAATLDFVLGIVTLGIGWLIWALIVHKDGMTPGKQLLGMRVVKTDTGLATSWMYTFLREWIVKDIIIFGTLGIGLLWILWDSQNQTLYDKILGTVVVDDRQGLTLAPKRRLALQTISVSETATPARE